MIIYKNSSYLFSHILQISTYLLREIHTRVNIFQVFHLKTETHEAGRVIPKYCHCFMNIYIYIHIYIYIIYIYNI